MGGIQLVNRVSPLFSFYSSSAQDSFYTAVPQIATAALSGHLRPLPGTEPNPLSIFFFHIMA